MIRLTLLGCGSSGGVPRIGGHWGLCDPQNPRNRRRRCSALIERISGPGPDAPRTQILVDTGPDLVVQMLDAGVSRLDGVVWTHPHADHIHGIDDLRQIAFNMRARLPGYADAETCAALHTRFGYIFETPEGSLYPPICTLDQIDGPFQIEGPGGAIKLTPLTVRHGEIDAIGLTIATQGGGITYLPDVSEIPETAWPLIGREVFICDALRRDPHPSHAHLPLALDWIAKSGAARGVVTNMHLDMDYDAVSADTPDHVSAAYDGMVIEAAAPDAAPA